MNRDDPLLQSFILATPLTGDAKARAEEILRINALRREARERAWASTEHAPFDRPAANEE